MLYKLAYLPCLFRAYCLMFITKMWPTYDKHYIGVIILSLIRWEDNTLTSLRRKPIAKISTAFSYPIWIEFYTKVQCEPYGLNCIEKCCMSKSESGGAGGPGDLHLLLSKSKHNNLWLKGQGKTTNTLTFITNHIPKKLIWMPNLTAY